MNLLPMLFMNILYRPIFNILIIFLSIFGGNLGIAIILLTITIRLIMIKQTSAGNDMQKGMSELQPKLTEIQEKYKDDPKKLSEETMKVFKTNGKGPLKGCLMMLIQIPVFLGLYTIIGGISQGGITSFGHILGFDQLIYSFFSSFGNYYTDIHNLAGFGVSMVNGVEVTHIYSLGIDLLGKNNILLTAIAAIGTFLQMKLTTLAKPATPAAGQPGMPDMSKMMGMMNIGMVVMMGFFVYTMNAGVGLYIVTTTLFSVAQYSIQYKALIKAKWIERKNKGQNIIIQK